MLDIQAPGMTWQGFFSTLQWYYFRADLVREVLTRFSSKHTYLFLLELGLPLAPLLAVLLEALHLLDDVGAAHGARGHGVRHRHRGRHAARPRRARARARHAARRELHAPGTHPLISTLAQGARVYTGSLVTKKWVAVARSR